MREETPTNARDPLFLSSLRELRVILGFWLFFCIWVVGYCSLKAYGNDGEGKVDLVLGMPSWVFWGVGLPWLAATVSTAFFASFFMKDAPLEAVEGEEA